MSATNANNAGLTLLQTRRSIRNFKSEPVPRELIEQVVTAGTYAASGRNLQSPIIIAVSNRELRDRIAQVNGEIMGVKNDPFYGAPVILIVLAAKSSPHRIYDGSLVMANLMLAAHAVGLGSCWIHRAKEEFERPEGLELLKTLGIEGEYEGIGHCALGYIEDEAPAAPPRKPNRVYYID